MGVPAVYSFPFVSSEKYLLKETSLAPADDTHAAQAYNNSESHMPTKVCFVIILYSSMEIKELEQNALSFV